jgi:hypothetical protein
MASWLFAHWVDALLRTLAFCAAIPILSAGYLMYEGEAEKVQSRLDTAWIQFDELRKKTLSRQAAFVRVVATKTVLSVDRLFGTRLVSVQALAPAFTLCLSSALLFWVLPVVLGFVRGKTLGIMGVMVLLFFETAFTVAGLYLLSLVLAPLVNENRRHLTKDFFTEVTVLAVLMTLALALINLVFGQWATVFAAPAIWLSCTAGGLVTLLTVSALRWGAVKTTSGEGEWPFVLVSLLPLAIGGGLAVIYAHVRPLAGEESSGYATVVLLTAASTTLALAPTFFVVTIATVLLLHRGLWPLAVRLFHNVPQASLLENKPLLRKVGWVLLAVVFFGLEKAAILLQKGVPELMAGISALFR